MKDCETKYRIMDTALELIWRNNYDSVGVSDICKAAKVNKGSFYHFFPSKEVLAVESLEYSWSQFQPYLDQVFSTQKNPIERLMDLCDFIFKMQKDKRDKVGHVCGCPYTNISLDQSSQSKLISESTQKCLARVKKYFVSTIKDAKDVGDINVKDVNKKADELFTYYLGTFAQAKIINDLKPIAGLKQVFKGMLGITKEAVTKV